MAYELSLFNLPAALAAADLSTKQYFIVKKNTTNNQFALCDTDGELFDGVLQNKPDGADKAAEIMAIGITKIEAGEILTSGDRWGTDSAGKAKIIEHTNTGADVGDYVGGVVIEGAASGSLATVSIGLVTFKVESV